MSSCLHCCPPKKCEFNFKKPQNLFNCRTAEQDNLIFASFSVCNVLGAWTYSFWVLIWRCCFSVTVVQEDLYPVVHEHVSYSSCNVMLMMCYFVLQTTVGSNKETLFMVLFLSISHKVNLFLHLNAAVICETNKWPTGGIILLWVKLKSQIPTEWLWWDQG